MNDELSSRIEQFQRCIDERDVGSAADVLDEEFALVLVHPAPAVVPRQGWLDMLPDYVVHEYNIEERTIDIDGDCAAIVHRARMRATVMGDDRSGLFVISDMWRRRDGEWRIWRRHSTPLSAGPMPSADR